MSQEVVTLTFPAKKEYILPIRLFFSGLATRADYSIDQIENVKLVIAEACSFLLTVIQSEEIEITVAMEEKMEVEVVPVGDPKRREIREEEQIALSLSRFMLEGMAKDVFIETDMLQAIKFCMEK